jgi:WD40 repeat protein
MNTSGRVALAALLGLMLALAGSGLSAVAGGTSMTARGPRVLFASDCGGAYSIAADGSRLTPLVPRTRRLLGFVVSGDGRTIAYTDVRAIYVARANGTRVRRLTGGIGFPAALSRDGRLLAITSDRGIWVVRTNGGGLRRVTSGRDDEQPDWSPDGKSFVFVRVKAALTSSKLVLQPLRGGARVLVRGAETVDWSPDGRWIAYGGKGLWLIAPDGGQRHRLVSSADFFTWAPDGKRLVIAASHGYRVIRVDGRSLRLLRLNLTPEGTAAPRWSPDGRLIAFSAKRKGDANQIWVVGTNGRGLRRLTKACRNELVGWTRLAPAVPSDPPPERIVGPETIATRDPVSDLSADGSRVAFVVSSTPTQCGHIAAWTPGTNTFLRVGDSHCVVSYGLELAGTRVGWAFVEGCGNSCDVSLYTATFEARAPLKICDLCGNFSADEGPPSDFNLHGDGDLLVFGDDRRLVRIGGGGEHCQEAERRSPAICTTLRRDSHVAPVDSVYAEQIAIRESDEVTVLNAQGAVVREFPFTPDEVSAARLDGGHLVVARLAVIDVYDVATGARLMSQPLPRGFKLSNVDGGIAVLRHGETIMLLRLDDGRSRTLAPGKGPRFAELEPPGLYYSYAIGAEGRVGFIPRSELF